MLDLRLDISHHYFGLQFFDVKEVDDDEPESTVSHLESGSSLIFYNRKYF